MSRAEQLNWPDNTHRTVVFGRTGSGKSVFGLWLLSTRDFDRMPWIIVDYKGDRLIRDIEAAGAREIDLKKAPTKPGLYIVRPHPNDMAQVDDFLLQCWSNENTGLFFDEGFMVPQQRPYKAFDAIMTQGRSKNVPVIACYQRPKWLSQFAMSQADFLACFHILKPDDRALLAEYTGATYGPNGERIDANTRLPDHFSLWYDVAGDRATVLRPAPAPDTIVNTFAARLTPKGEETPAKRGIFV
jgi:hypothetical protein